MKFLGELNCGAPLIILYIAGSSTSKCHWGTSYWSCSYSCNWGLAFYFFTLFGSHSWCDFWGNYCGMQDTIIHWRRMSGFNTLWVPGMYHAGIATQVKFKLLYLCLIVSCWATWKNILICLQNTVIRKFFEFYLWFAHKMSPFTAVGWISYLDLSVEMIIIIYGFKFLENYYCCVVEP